MRLSQQPLFVLTNRFLARVDDEFCRGVATVRVRVAPNRRAVDQDEPVLLLRQLDDVARAVAVDDDRRKLDHRTTLASPSISSLSWIATRKKPPSRKLTGRPFEGVRPGVRRPMRRASA